MENYGKILAVSNKGVWGLQTLYEANIIHFIMLLISYM